MSPLAKPNGKSCTRGEAEAEITRAVIKFEKEHLGRGRWTRAPFLFKL
jgi:hypothetical protein